MSRCDSCVTDRSQCDGCRNNPKYANIPTGSLYAAYKPVCTVGHTDCIYDPAYIKCHHPAWYKQMYGDKAPEEVMKTKNCYERVKGDPHACWGYDDEDK